MRLSAVAVAGALVLATAVPLPAAAANTPATAAAEFLAHEFTRLGDKYPSATSPGNNDAGLMADALLGMHQAGVEPGVQAAATSALRQNFFSATIVAAGTIGKDLIVASEQGVDARHWGNDSAGRNIDLIARLQAAQNPSGSYTDTSAQGARTPSNVFSQALAVIGLHKAGVPSAAGVRMLVRQQCPGGGFRLNVPDGGETGQCTTDTDSSADTTAMGVWALVDAGGHAQQVAKALDWLRANEDPATGAFSADPKSPGQVNTNSSGLAAMALAMGGDATTASRVNGWLASMQVPADAAVAEMAGAVVRGQSDLDAIDANAKGFWFTTSGADNLGKQDGLRRATAQAVLGLAAATVGPAPPPPTRGKPVPQQGHPAPGKSAGTPVGGTGGAAPGTQGVPDSAAAPSAGTPIPAPPAPPGAGFGGVPGGAPSAPGFAGPGQLNRAGEVRALHPTGSFAAFLSSPEGILLAVLAGLLLAGGTFWILVRRKGSRA